MSGKGEFVLNRRKMSGWCCNCIQNFFHQSHLTHKSEKNSSDTYEIAGRRTISSSILQW